MYTIFVNLASGESGQCYRCNFHQNVFADLNKSIEFVPIGQCQQPHCYNGHALLTFGNIPHKFNNVKFGDDIRDRVKTDGSHWLQPKLLAFFNSRLDESDNEISVEQKVRFYLICKYYKIKHYVDAVGKSNIRKRIMRKLTGKNHGIREGSEKTALKTINMHES